MLNIEKLSEMNHWWKLGHVKEELSMPYKRRMFNEIERYINLRQIIGIIGLRRVGKTTVLYQIVEHLIKNRTNPKNIMYFSFDEAIEELDELIRIYKEEVVKIDLSSEKIYIFLDEIQKLKDWQNKIKIYYDIYPNIKFFVSGSASINILLPAKETLAGRIYYFNLDIPSFDEFLELRGKELNKMRNNLKLWSSELRTELNHYLIKPFPEIVSQKDEIARKYIKESVIEKAIFRDLSFLFEIKDVELIEKLVEIIGSNPGIIINLDDFSKDFGRSRQVISNYLYYLECCFLVKSLKNFRGSLKASSRKLKKYYLSHPCLALSFALPEEGKIAENLVQFATQSKNFWRQREKEVDFIALKGKEILPMEVKYSRTIKEKDFKNILNFMENYKVDSAVVITKDYEAEKKIDAKNIRLIPLWKWLLEN